MPGRPGEGDIASVTDQSTTNLPPPDPNASVRLQTEGGQPLTAITKDQSFVAVVETSRPASGDPPQNITVVFRPPDGSGHELTLKWDGGVKGNARYVSEPITVAHGAEGSIAMTLPSPVRSVGSNPATGVEFRVGGMTGASLPILGLDVPNGGTLSVSYGSGPGAATSSVVVYDTVDKMVIAFNDDFFARIRKEVIDRLEAIKKLPPSDAVKEARRRLEHKILLLDKARVSLSNPQFTDIDRAVWGSQWVKAILAPIDQTVAPSDLSTFFTNAAENTSKERKQRLLYEFVRDVVLGYYQLVIGQIPLAGALWSVLIGTDIMGRKLDGWERLEAVIDLTTQGAMLALPVAMNAETNVRGTVSEPPRVGSGGGKAGEPKVPFDITKAPAGTRVEWVEDMGLEGRQAQKFNLVIEQFNDIYGQRIRIAVRKTGAARIDADGTYHGPGALGKAAEGTGGKSEPMKSKSANEVDIEGGWSTEPDAISYFTPEQIAARFKGLKPEDIIVEVPDPANPGQTKWVQPEPPAGVRPKVWKRAGQRIREHWDEKHMMDEILSRGLAELREDGVIIDRGITNYTLDPETHELVKTFDGPPNGTGKPIYGDPDLYGLFFEDGTPLTVEQIAPIVKALGPQWTETPDGWFADGARVMHPDVYSWKPKEIKNQDIQKVILGGSEGVQYGWKNGPRGLEPVYGPKTDSTEPLIVFGGVSEPPVITYGNVPIPKGAFKGRDFGGVPYRFNPSKVGRNLRTPLGIGLLGGLTLLGGGTGLVLGGGPGGNAGTGGNGGNGGIGPISTPLATTGAASTIGIGAGQGSPVAPGGASAPAANPTATSPGSVSGGPSTGAVAVCDINAVAAAALVPSPVIPKTNFTSENGIGQALVDCEYDFTVSLGKGIDIGQGSHLDAVNLDIAGPSKADQFFLQWSGGTASIAGNGAGAFSNDHGAGQILGGVAAAASANATCDILKHADCIQQVNAILLNFVRAAIAGHPIQTTTTPGGTTDGSSGGSTTGGPFTISPMAATFVDSQFLTIYKVTLSSTTGTRTYRWTLTAPSADPTCNHFGSLPTDPSSAVWHHGDQDGCNHNVQGPNGHPGTVTATISDGTGRTCTATYDGTNTGTGPAAVCGTGSSTGGSTGVTTPGGTSGGPPHTTTPGGGTTPVTVPSSPVVATSSPPVPAALLGALVGALLGLFGLAMIGPSPIPASPAPVPVPIPPKAAAKPRKKKDCRREAEALSKADTKLEQARSAAAAAADATKAAQAAHDAAHDAQQLAQSTLEAVQDGQKVTVTEGPRTGMRTIIREGDANTGGFKDPTAANIHNVEMSHRMTVNEAQNRLDAANDAVQEAEANLAAAQAAQAKADAAEKAALHAYDAAQRAYDACLAGG